MAISPGHLLGRAEAYEDFVLRAAANPIGCPRSYLILRIITIHHALLYPNESLADWYEQLKLTDETFHS